MTASTCQTMIQQVCKSDPFFIYFFSFLSSFFLPTHTSTDVPHITNIPCHRFPLLSCSVKSPIARTMQNMQRRPCDFLYRIISLYFHPPFLSSRSTATTTTPLPSLERTTPSSFTSYMSTWCPFVLLQCCVSNTLFIK